MTDKLRELLKERNLDALLVSSHHNILYLTSFNGFIPEDRDGFLLITKNTKYIITSSLYSEAVLTQISHFKLLEISYALPFSAAIKKLILKHKIKILGIEETDLRVSEFKKIKGLVKTKDYSLSKIRAIKLTSEIEKIKRACVLGDETFKHMLKIIKPGKSEKDLALEIENFIKSKGGEFSFDPIIAFNEHASMPHHRNSDKKLVDKSGQLILMDFGVKIDNYCSDMTRVVFWGKATSEQKKIYQIVLNSQQKAVAYLQTQLKGVRLNLVDEVAREYIKSEGLPPFNHGLGHGIGLQVHEAPRLSITSKDVLENGMVFSIEPGIYLPGKFGVRIEDLYTIDKGKLIQLTKSPTEIIEL